MKRSRGVSSGSIGVRLRRVVVGAVGVVGWGGILSPFGWFDLVLLDLEWYHTFRSAATSFWALAFAPSAFALTVYHPFSFSYVNWRVRIEYGIPKTLQTGFRLLSLVFAALTEYMVPCIHYLRPCPVASSIGSLDRSSVSVISCCSFMLMKSKVTAPIELSQKILLPART
jgi:hypothetical protein